MRPLGITMLTQSQYVAVLKALDFDCGELRVPDSVLVAIRRAA